MTTRQPLTACQQIEACLADGYPVVVIETWEEERVEQLLTKADCGEVWVWSLTRGFHSGPGENTDLSDPLAALAFAIEKGGAALVLFRDFPQELLHSPRASRLFRDGYDGLIARAGRLIFCAPRADIPADTVKEVFFLKLALPTRAELLTELSTQNAALTEERRYDHDWLEHCAADMAGLTVNEARDLLLRLDRQQIRAREQALQLIRQQRSQLLMKESCLSVVDIEAGLDQIGGLGNLKEWITSRKALFGLEAQNAGIDPPSGILMMGVSGCGKSLAAKAIATAWGLTLVRIDMNLIMSGAWGSPELAWDRALKSLEAVAPVVVWFDEIENGFGYINGQVTGGNQTIFSSFLTWMQEKTSQVFVVATANRIELLPAEMLRKGRFDELFFLDLPAPDARAEVLAIHIARQGGDPTTFDLPQLAALLDGWTASEIEQLVRSAKLQGFYENRDFTFTDLKNLSFKMVPLSKTMSEQVNELRRWSRHRAAPAA